MRVPIAMLNSAPTGKSNSLSASGIKVSSSWSSLGPVSVSVSKTLSMNMSTSVSQLGPRAWSMSKSKSSKKLGPSHW